MKQFLAAILVGLPGIAAILFAVKPPDGVPFLALAVNPLIFLAVGAFLGARFAARGGFHSSLILNSPIPIGTLSLFSVAGVLAGWSIALVDHWSAPLWNPGSARTMVDQKAVPHVLVRVLYGGVTEEIMFRWGLVSALFVAFSRALSRGKATFAAVGVGAIVFAAAHLPGVITDSGSATVGLIARTMIWNALVGTMFGWAYVKGGLETACAAHIGFHLGALAAAI